MNGNNHTRIVLDHCYIDVCNQIMFLAWDMLLILRNFKIFFHRWLWNIKIYLCIIHKVRTYIIGKLLKHHSCLFLIWLANSLLLLMVYINVIVCIEINMCHQCIQCRLIHHNHGRMHFHLVFQVMSYLRHILIKGSTLRHIRCIRHLYYIHKLIICSIPRCHFSSYMHICNSN